MSATEPARVPVTRGVRDVGLLNALICRVGARGIRAPEFHLFNALAQSRSTMWTYLPFAGSLLYWGRLPKRDTELVILRVGTLRGSEYELQQHRRLARSRGVDNALQARIFEGPDADGLTERQRALIKATDEFILDRTVSDETWSQLAQHLSERQLIEFCFLAGHYDMVAATLNTLKVPLDFPD